MFHIAKCLCASVISLLNIGTYVFFFIYTIKANILHSVFPLLAGICEVKTLSKVDGEASANNRKGKLIFFYEWNITGEWSGMCNYILILFGFRGSEILRFKRRFNL